jgi:hypothetical protein
VIQFSPPVLRCSTPAPTALCCHAPMLPPPRFGCVAFLGCSDSPP